MLYVEEQCIHLLEESIAATMWFHNFLPRLSSEIGKEAFSN